MNASTGIKTPLYQRIASSLRDEILSGRYPQGSQLPPESALCEQFNVSRITVRGALDLLATEGLLRREQGRGTFVAEGPVEHSLIRLTDFVEDMAAAGLTPSSHVVHWGDEPANDEVASALQVQPGALITRLERLRLADERPIAFDVTYLLPRFSRLLAQERLATETIYHQLEADYGIPVVSGTFIIEATIALPPLPEYLALPAQSAVLVMRRTSFSTNNEPIYYQVRSYRADRVRYRAELRREPLVPHSRLTEFGPVFQLPEGR